MAVNDRAKGPLFSRAGQSKSVKDYLAKLDELLRRNRGGFSAVAEETGSSVPFILPGRSVRAAEPEMASQRQMAELPQPEQYPIEWPETVMPEGEVLGDQSGPSVGQFLEQIYQNLGVSDPMYLTGTQTVDGGTLLSNGEVVYPSGNITTQSGEDVYAMGSAPGGGLLYSDGQIRYIDPRTPGLEGLMEVLGLSGQTITQPYGYYNPELGYESGYHSGTDIRTRDLSNKAFSLPFEVQVLQVITADSGSPYGNSVLLALPNGEAIRLSHLSSLGNVRDGAKLPPGTFIGVAGSTGRSTGEHLDLEFYNKDGQLSDPSTFSGISQPQELAQYVPPEIQANYSTQTAQTAQPSQPTQEQPQISEGVAKLQEAAKTLGYDTNNLTPKQRSDVALTSMGFHPEGTIGFQEALMGDFPAAGRELSQTIERINPTPRIDLGISEALRGDLPGAKQQFASTMERAGNRLARIPGQIKEAVINPAFAGDGQQPRESLGENLQYIGSKIGEYGKAKAGEVLGAAGAGLEKLKSGVFSKGGAGANLFSRPAASSINQQRAVGEFSGGSSMLPTGSFAGSAAFKRADVKNDIRDPFFKSGADKAFSGYINPQAAETGALSLDLFSPEFYSKASNIGQVFKGTQFEQPAQTRYIDSVKQDFLSKYGGADYDPQDVQRILSSLGSSQFGSEINLPEPQRSSSYLQRMENDRRIQEINDRIQAEAAARGETPKFISSLSNVSFASQSPEQREQQSTQRIADYATGDIGKQLQTKPQPAPSSPYQPYQQTVELMRQSQTQAPPQQTIFQKAGSSISNLFKKWFQ